MAGPRRSRGSIAGSGQISHRWPQFLPDGRRYLFFAFGTVPGATSSSNGVYLGSLDSPEIRPVLPGGARAEYAPPGHLLSPISVMLDWSRLLAR